MAELDKHHEADSRDLLVTTGFLRHCWLVSLEW